MNPSPIQISGTNKSSTIISTVSAVLRPAGIPTYGVSGVFLDVDDVDWDEIATIVEAAYRTVAPKRLLKNPFPLRGLARRWHRARNTWHRKRSPTLRRYCAMISHDVTRCVTQGPPQRGEHRHAAAPRLAGEIGSHSSPLLCH